MNSTTQKSERLACIACVDVYQFCLCCCLLCELRVCWNRALAMRRGSSNSTRPSLLGPLRDPGLATAGHSPSVMSAPTATAVSPLTAFQGECSRSDTLHVIMRPLVSLPIYPDFSEFLAGMATPTSRLNTFQRSGKAPLAMLWQSESLFLDFTHYCSSATYDTVLI